MTDVVHCCIIEGAGGVQSWRCCGDDNGDASQEQQRAGGLVDSGAEFLGVEFVPSNHETASCMHSPKLGHKAVSLKRCMAEESSDHDALLIVAQDFRQARLYCLVDE